MLPTPSISPLSRSQAQDLLHFIDASPSPWHAVHNCALRLQAQGYCRLDEKQRWSLRIGGKYWLERGGSMVAFIVGQRPLADSGLRLLGAHTDSPGLRLKPHAPHHCDGLLRLGVEVYGGPILATFTDRDLSLAGRVNVRSGAGFSSRLLRFEQPLLRLPNLAIHMNREVNEQGLKLHKQNELPLLLGMAASSELDADGSFRQLLAGQLQVDAKDIINWELTAYDTQPGSFWGREQEFIANSQLDNLASCHAALTALLATEHPEATSLCAFFDHEEVGSESATGAAGSLVSDVISRIAAKFASQPGSAAGCDEEARHRALANSFFISADMAHAWHPNFPAAYEPGHHLLMNAGPAIKSNANQRYSSSADSAAHFLALCERIGVPCQQYTHRSDLGCGSTIGPIIAARLGMTSVDIGSPMWAMHSVRESAGVADHGYLIQALTAALQT